MCPRLAILLCANKLVSPLAGVPIIMARNVQQRQQHPCTTTEEPKHQRARGAAGHQESATGECQQFWSKQRPPFDQQQQQEDQDPEQDPQQHPLVPQESVHHHRSPRQHELLHHQRKVPPTLPARGRHLISEGARRREVRGCGAGGGGLLCCSLDALSHPAKLLQFGVLLLILLLATYGDLAQAEGNVGECPLRNKQITSTSGKQRQMGKGSFYCKCA